MKIHQVHPPVCRSTPDSRPDRTMARFGTALGCCVTSCLSCYQAFRRSLAGRPAGYFYALLVPPLAAWWSNKKIDRKAAHPAKRTAA
ncbi:hypothetical protein Tph_c26790 [Thermacetogenium phaeum DSM 12270]|uniref:Uncharacterized protein n=1 Tax=Thermacetogenium phaeum (strain ATCC BAA-254 / DSM 26808 / PB) TaxID=1089553 RepID=K4LLB4_THEPS|nr:hypothetical protein [Thermacetogenium phaeum]AFV12847.1 hypothetical protein Tph_c26790 [Thermacetogenium phaeum DSM 12270]